MLNGRLFALPPSARSTKLTWPQPQIIWTMTYLHTPDCFQHFYRENVQVWLSGWRRQTATWFKKKLRYSQKKDPISQRVSHNLVTMEIIAIRWPLWLITFWHLWIWRNHEKWQCLSLCNCSDIQRYQNVINQGGHPFALASMVTTLCIGQCTSWWSVLTEWPRRSRGHSVRTDQPASTLSDIMHTPLLTGAAVVCTRAPEHEKNVVW